MFTKSIAVVVLVLAAQLVAPQAQETRAIPMNTVYVTFTQEGLNPVEAVAEEEDLARLFAILQESPRQAVLCMGSDARAAVRGSIANFMMNENEMPTIAGAASETLWMAAYLGAEGSMPPAFQVRRVEVNGKTIRIAYEPSTAAMSSCDLRAYMVWVPVGPMEAGAYTLELFDVAEQAVTLSRTWHVAVN